MCAYRTSAFRSNQGSVFARGAVWGAPTSQNSSSSHSNTNKKRINEIPKTLKELVQPIMDIQIFLANQKNIDGSQLFENLIQESFCQPQNYNIVINELVYLTKIRPVYLMQIAETLTLFHMFIDQQSSSDQVLRSCIIFEAYKLLRVLVFNAGLLNKSFVQNHISSNEDGNCAIFFSDQFPEYIKYIPEWGYSTHYRIAYKTVKKLNKKGDLSTLSYILDNGWEPGNIMISIKKDSVADLQKFIQNSSEISQLREWSQFEWFPEPKVCSYFSCAALFGAINCFRWFISKFAVITDPIIDSALIGFNESILIEIANEQKHFATERVHVPIYHKYHLYDYIEKTPWKITLSVLAEKKCRNYASIVECTTNGTTICSTDQMGENGFHHMAKAGMLEFVNIFMKVSKGAEELTDQRKSIIHCAAESGNVRLLKFLIDKHFMTSQKQWGLKYTLFHSAALSGDVKMFRFVASRAKEMGSYSLDSIPDIMEFAAFSGSVPLIKYLNKMYQYPLTYQSKTGISLLYQAFVFKKTDLIEYLFKHGLTPQKDQYYEDIRTIAKRNNLMKYIITI